MEHQDVSKLELWSDARRTIREALDLHTRSAILWLDTTGEPGERDRAKAQADQAEQALRDMVRALVLARPAKPLLDEVEDLRNREATLRAELAAKTSEANLLAGEVRALRALVDALIRSANLSNLADALYLQSRAMVDIFVAQEREEGQ